MLRCACDRIKTYLSNHGDAEQHGYQTNNENESGFMLT